MSLISTSNYYIPFLCKALNYSPALTDQCIVCVDEESKHPIAGVIYSGYNGAIVMAHIWVDPERKPSPEWFGAIFDYPFNRMKVHKIVGQVNSTNADAVKLDLKFGFQLEAVVKGFYEGGNDLLVFTMTRDQCRVLTSPRWAKIMERISRI